MLSKTQKNLKRAALLFIVAAILLLLMQSASARSYSVDSLETDVVVDENGIAYVTHKMHYTFHTSPGDEYREVFFVLPYEQNASLRNITGYLEGYDTTYSVSHSSGGYEAACRLPSPNPQSVVFVVSCEYYGGVNVYNDVTEFNFILKSSLWDRTIQKYDAAVTIHDVPSQKITETDYYLIFSHPKQNAAVDVPNIFSGSKAGTTTIQTNVSAENVPPASWIDIRIIYPRMENPNPEYVKIIPENGLNKILNEEKAYERKNLYPYFFMLLQSLIIFLGLALPVAIYFKYGREPQVNYHALYERDLPTDTKPAIVNTIVAGHGKPNMHAFTSTLMSLVDRKYLSLREIEISYKKKPSKDIVLRFEKEPDLELEDFEQSVYLFLKRHAVNNEIVWKDFLKKLGKNDRFYNFITGWNNAIIQKSKFSSYFDNTGNKHMTNTGIGLLIFSFLMFFVSNIVVPVHLYPATGIVEVLCILSGILAVVLILYPVAFKKSMGRWTPEGHLFYLKWMNFSKYLTDYSLIKQYPPASIIIWDHFIVYAMALGVAETALKNMNLSMPTAQMDQSRLGRLHYYPFFYLGMSGAYTASTPGSGGSGGGGIIGGGGGFGGIGGGFGGGFGGAR